MSLVFIGIRVLYGLVAESTQKADLNPVTGSLAIRVVLSFLPELIAVLIFVFEGFRTRDVQRYQKMDRTQPASSRWTQLGLIRWCRQFHGVNPNLNLLLGSVGIGKTQYEDAVLVTRTTYLIPSVK